MGNIDLNPLQQDAGNALAITGLTQGEQISCEETNNLSVNDHAIGKRRLKILHAVFGNIGLIKR